MYSSCSIFPFFFCFTCVKTLTCPSNYKLHKVQNSTLPELCCPSSICNPNEVESYELASCCDCNGIPEYIINSLHVEQLFIEYVSASGQGLVVESSITQSGLQKLIHNKGFLTAFPYNICNFTNLVHIDLSYNKIKHIGYIKCLQKLDILILSHNDIEKISNNTFQGLSSLRELHLKNNKIIHLSPFGIGGDGLTMLTVTMDGNLMSSLDASNFVLKREFCTMTFKKTPISQITNDENLVLDVKNMHGPGGYVDLQGIAMKHFPDLTLLGVQDIVSLTTLFPFGFDIRDCEITCDCYIEPFVAIALDVTKKIMRDYFNVTCYNPPELRGQSILGLAHQNLDVFVCNVTSQNGCPIGCHCFQQPSQSRTVVDCANKNLSKLPTHMPNVSISTKNLEINLSGNNISVMEPRDYFVHTSILDLANNSLLSISTDVLSSFRNISLLKLGDNPVTKMLPKNIQSLDACSLYLGSEIEVHCDCDNLWVGDWVRNKNIENCKSSSNQSLSVMCITKDGNRVPAQKVNAEFLKCNLNKNLYTVCFSILAVLIAIVLGGWLYNMYKIEIYIMYRSSSKVKYHTHWEYDFFLIWNESNAFLTGWVRKKFMPDLEAGGYTINTPSRDFSLGEVEIEEVHRNMRKCRDVIVILSDDLFHGSTNNIANIAWEYYAGRRIRNFIIVNFDLVRRKNVKKGFMRAFFKLDMVIDFSNREKTFYKIIKRQLGRPLTFFKNQNCTAMIKRNIKMREKFDLYLEDMDF